MKLTAMNAAIGSIQTVAGKPVTAKKVTIGAASIGKLTIQRLNLGFPKVAASLRGVRVSVEVMPSFDWSITLGAVERSGSIEPGSLSVDIFDSAVDFALPQGIQGVSVDELSLEDLALTSAQISGDESSDTLDLGQILVSTLKAVSATTDDMALPPKPPTVGLEKLEINDIAMVDEQPVVVTSASVDKVSVESLPIPTLSIGIGQIVLPPVDGLPITSKKLVVDGPIVERTVGDDDGSFRWHLGLKMVGRLEIQELVLTVDTSMSIGGIDLGNVSLPITVEGLDFGNPEIRGLSVANVKLESS
jgi:hypothetical protein